MMEGADEQPKIGLMKGKSICTPQEEGRMWPELLLWVIWFCL
jgi:hypothetical protein